MAGVSHQALIASYSGTSGFPEIVGTPVATTQNALTATRNITLPTGIVAGELVVIPITVGGTSITFTPPTGFTEVAGALSSGTINGTAFYKFCDGSESGTITCTTSATVLLSAATAMRISGADSGTAPTATATTGTSTTPDPPNHTPAWGSAKNLWIAAFGKNASASFTSYPTNYSLAKVGGAVSNIRTNSAARQLEASSEDPGNFTISASIEWHAMTIAVKPA